MHLELSCVEIDPVEIFDARVDVVVHGKGVVEVLGRVCEAWAHNLL